MCETATTDDFANVIATASLLLAVVAALFSLWYGEITDTVAMPNTSGKISREALRNKIWKALAGKAIPLAMASSLNALIFAPRAYFATMSSVSLLGDAWRYDDLKAAFLLTEFMMIALAIFSLWLVMKLLMKLFANRESAK